MPSWPPGWDGPASDASPCVHRTTSPALIATTLYPVDVLYLCQPMLGHLPVLIKDLLKMAADMCQAIDSRTWGLVLKAVS